jgi:hypothetical protein
LEFNERAAQWLVIRGECQLIAIFDKVN